MVKTLIMEPVSVMGKGNDRNQIEFCIPQHQAFTISLQFLLKDGIHFLSASASSEMPGIDRHKHFSFALTAFFLYNQHIK